MALIHYHGTPMTPDKEAVKILQGRHGLVSFAYPQQIALVATICKTFVLDNGEFPFWKSGKPMKDWSPYYEFVDEWAHHPCCDFAIIPDVIDGTEEENDKLIQEWPFSTCEGVPVWHMHESLDRLSNLADSFPRIALGSSGEFASPGTKEWWGRMSLAMETVCTKDGRPRTKLHGLRMLNPKVFTKLPLTSADSSSVARNMGIDKVWKGTYLPPNKGIRGIVLAERIESNSSAPRWEAECLTQ